MKCPRCESEFHEEENLDGNCPDCKLEFRWVEEYIVIFGQELYFYNIEWEDNDG